jgi:hypothetical protein
MKTTQILTLAFAMFVAAFALPTPGTETTGEVLTGDYMICNNC